MNEVEAMRRGDRSVIAGRRCRAGKAAGVVVQTSVGAARLVGPMADSVGHEADAIGSIAIVETFTERVRCSRVNSAVKVTSLNGFPEAGPFKAISKTPHCSTVSLPAWLEGFSALRSGCREPANVAALIFSMSLRFISSSFRLFSRFFLI